MRWHLVLALLVLLALVAEGKKKKPGKKPGVKGECKTKGPVKKLTAQNTAEYTDSGKCACWWDITKNHCACCKPGSDAMQCGYPQHKFCYKKSDMGCPGVCNNEFTLSTKGYPCYSDHDSKKCAWCNKEGYQCEQNKITGPDSKMGSRCSSKTNQKYCKSQQGDCKHIGYCDINADCKKKDDVGQFGQYWQCECKAPEWQGNGIQCMDANGTLSSDPNQHVEVSLTMTSGLYSPTHTDGEFSHGTSMETLLGEMASANSACSGAGCESTYTVTET